MKLKRSCWTECPAEIFLHSHYKTGEIIQLEIITWNGSRQLLRELEEEDIRDLLELLEDQPTEEILSATVIFDREDDLYVKDILWHND